MTEQRTTWSLIRYFLHLGSVGFGGPAALLGCMQRDLVERRGWFTKDEYIKGLALSQLAPELSRLQVTRVALITTRSLVAQEKLLDQVRGALGGADPGSRASALSARGKVDRRGPRTGYRRYSRDRRMASSDNDGAEPCRTTGRVVGRDAWLGYSCGGC